MAVFTLEGGYLHKFQGKIFITGPQMGT